MIIKGDLKGLELLIPTPPEYSLIADFTKITNEFNKTGLHIAAEMGYDDIIEFLFHNGADLEAYDNIERTALHYAALSGHSVQTLLYLGSQHLIQDDLKRTPCHLAVMSGHVNWVKTFLEKEPKLVYVKDSFDRTILHYAMFTKGDSYKLTELILRYNPRVNQVDWDGHTALYYACHNDHENSVRILLRHGAEPPEITTLKYNKIFLSHKFENFHVPRINLDIPDPETEKWAKSLEERIKDNETSLEKAMNSKMLSQIGNRPQKHWVKMYLNQDVSDDQPSTVPSKYEVFTEIDSETRSNAVTDATARASYEDEIENYKVLVNALNQKLESANLEFQQKVDKMEANKEKLERLAFLENRYETILKENTLLQDKLDELLNTIDFTLDQVDKLKQTVEQKDDELMELKSEIPRIKELEDYKTKIEQLEEYIDKLKAEMMESKRKAGLMYQELQKRFQKAEAEKGKFSVDYFVFGRFIRVIDKETLSNFRRRLENQDHKKTGMLKFEKVK